MNNITQPVLWWCQAILIKRASPTRTSTQPSWMQGTNLEYLLQAKTNFLSWMYEKSIHKRYLILILIVRLVISVLWSMKHQEILQNNTPCLKMLLPRWVFYVVEQKSNVILYQGLSMIDTTQSAIKPYCPPFLMAPACSVKRYRSVEGICNNMENPHWGAAMNGHHR